jgi:pyruvate/2-oxoglutarate dehydrogenase complex dihydrolipoamide acyltransferase (E2) component
MPAGHVRHALGINSQQLTRVFVLACPRALWGSMMYLALSYDHRIIDGREAVSFLVRIKECVESPERLLLEI